MPGTLNSDQQEKLSRIMSVPTKTSGGQVEGTSIPTTPAYQVAELSNPTNPTQTIRVGEAASATTSESNEAKKSGIKGILPILLLIGGIILLGGYAFFWLKFFRLF